MLLDQQNYKKTRWRNGQGTTAEIAICPEGASLCGQAEALGDGESFLWRLSTASVESSRPFSRFSGYDRFLTLVSGESLVLCSELGKERRGEVLHAGKILHFSGDDSVRCELPQGKITDLGLIYRRGLVKAEFKILDVAMEPQPLKMTARQTFIFVISGATEGALAGDTLSLGAGEFDLNCSHDGAKVALISLDW